MNWALFCNAKFRKMRLWPVYLSILVLLLFVGYFNFYCGITTQRTEKDGYVVISYRNVSYAYPNFFGNYDERKQCGRAPQTCDITKPVVPNIVHYIWSFVSTKDISFIYLIGYLSVLQHQAPEEMWFWCEKDPPKGPNWDEFMVAVNRSKTKLRFRHLRQPKEIHGIPIPSEWPQHATDFTRLEILLKHGGIYLDSDVIVINDLTPLRCYHYTGGLQSESCMNNGFIMSNKESRFLSLYYDSYRRYRRTRWDWNSVSQHFRLYREHPDLIHVEPYCINFPMDVEHLYGDTHFDWSNHYVIHVFNKEYASYDIDRKNITTLNTSLAEVAYYIYHGVKRKDTVFQ